jgi:16S rRNA processing protein RimM
MPGEPLYLAVGRLRRPHGVEGEILMDVLTDFPERLHVGRTLYAGPNHEPVKLSGLRGPENEKIVRLVGYDTPETVGRFRNVILYVPVSELPKLPEGEYYHHQLLGLSVVDEAGQELGRLDQILETGANDIYVVKTPENKELLLPAIEEVVLEINLEKGQILVRLMEWY